MKIKTITCHEVYNVGASLQAYALEKYLQELGHEVEIIDYKPDYLVAYKLLGIDNPIYNRPVLRELYQLAKLPGRIKRRYGKRKKEFDRFTQKYLSVTPKRYKSNEELKKDLPEADIFFAGSDQIWNTLFNNGKDPAFYLDFAPKSAIRASYAASFATEDIVEEYKSKVREWLNNLNYISVRESSGVEIAKKLTNKEVVQVLDPVFLLNREKWKRLEKKLPASEPYVLIYDFDNNKNLYKFAFDLAQKNGWKVYSFLKNNMCDRSFENEGPEAFLWLIHHAKFVVSNSFHATAFSIIYQKQFVVFNRKEAINTRMRDLVLQLGMSSCIVHEHMSVDVVNIDYDAVQKKLNKEIIKSKQYIEKVLESQK